MDHRFKLLGKKHKIFGIWARKKVRLDTETMIHKRKN